MVMMQPSFAADHTMRRTMLSARVIAGCLSMCERAGDITGEVVEVGTFELGPGRPGMRETHFTAPARNGVAMTVTGYSFDRPQSFTILAPD